MKQKQVQPELHALFGHSSSSRRAVTMGYGRGFTRPVTLPVHTVTGASKVGQVPNTESSKPAASYRERVHGVVPGYAGSVWI